MFRTGERTYLWWGLPLGRIKGSGPWLIGKAYNQMKAFIFKLKKIKKPKVLVL